MSSLSIEVRSCRPLALLQLQGSFAQLEVYPLKKQVGNLLELGYRYLILDLSKVDFVDNEGIGALSHFHQASCEHGGYACVVRPVDHRIICLLETLADKKFMDVQPNPFLALQRLRRYSGLELNDPEIMDDSVGEKASASFQAI